MYSAKEARYMYRWSLVIHIHNPFFLIKFCRIYRICRICRILLPPTNEVCEGCFYTCLSVILFTGGGEYLGRYTPPGLGRYTHGQVHSPGQVHPLGRFTPHPSRYAPSRYMPPPRQEPPWQVHPLAGTPAWAGTPPGRYTPRQVHPHPLGAVHDGRYGQQAGGMHPTGMYSCF